MYGSFAGLVRNSIAVRSLVVALVAASLAIAPGSRGYAQGAAPEVRLEASASVVTWRDAVRFTGQVSSPEAPECARNVEVVLLADDIDDMVEPEEVARARSDDTGAFLADVRAEESAIYVASVVPSEVGGCEAAGSNPVEVMTRFEVTLERSSLVVDEGEEVRLTARVEPFCPIGGPSGDVRKIPLYQLRGDRFVRVAAKRDVNDCTITFTRRIRRLSVFMSKVPENEELHAVYLGGRSREIAVTVRD